ncbi:site-2 protease family protein [Streptomyces sp. 135]|uniref:site-2 protease family protein n=1 Tax=Streptomyces sp. 135 TaxID=2838850 RepID=UPI001CBB997E|nr:site-2 protease family protein [Streptomyces sp. 135]
MIVQVIAPYRGEGRFDRGDIVDESGESGRPRSDGAEGLRPNGTDGSPEPPRPDATPQHPTLPVDPDPASRPAPPVTNPAEDKPAQPDPTPPTSPEAKPSQGDDGATAGGPASAPQQPAPRPAVPAAESPQGDDGGAGERRRVPTVDEAAAVAGQPAKAPDGGAGDRRRMPTVDEAPPAAGHPAKAQAPATDTPQQPPARPAVPMTKPPRAADGQDAAPPATEHGQDPAPHATGHGQDPAPRSTEHPPAPRPGDAAYGAADGKGGPTPPKTRKNPGGGLLMGRPFGVPVYVAPSWFLVAALITWVFGGQLDRVLPELGATRYLVSLFFAVAFYASVLVHELAHTVAALRFKLPVRRIQLQFFGGVSEIEKESETPGREFILAFVGPLLSLILAGVFYAGMRAVEPGTVPGVLLAGLMISNLIVAAFNLLPGLPLDGGRMLRAVVWKITGKPMSGTIAAAWVGRALAISVLIGLPLLNQSGALGGEPQDIGGMDTVTDALLAAILAAIIWTGAGNSLRMARLREHLPELRARTLTRRAVPVESHTPLSEALRRANGAGARALVIVDPDGDPMAVVREAAIVSVPQHRRPWVAVSGLAQDITEGMRISAELAGEELLDTLRATPATEYLVVEDSGEIYGVLSAADVERAFVKAMARPS